MTKTKYFDFSELAQKKGQATVAKYLGWNGLSVTRLDLPKGIAEWESLIGPSNNAKDEENIIVVTKGAIELKSGGHHFALGKNDAADLAFNLKGYQLRCSEDATAFNIRIGDVKLAAPRPPIVFNFEKDLEARDLWGSQCISRPYEGELLTLVLFDLKPGFTFEDKGHVNEQITWLTSGSMSFYADGDHRTMTTEVGVDIGLNHLHGGVSEGAIGFDAFFPKKKEAKYTKEGKK